MALTFYHDNPFGDDHAPAAAIHIYFADDREENHGNFKLTAMTALKSKPNHFIVHMLYNPDDLLDGIRNEKVNPDNMIVVTDRDMEWEIDGVEAAKRIKTEFPQIPVAIWSGTSNEINAGDLPQGVMVYSKTDLKKVFDEVVLPAVEAIATRPVKPGSGSPGPSACRAQL